MSRPSDASACVVVHNQNFYQLAAIQSVSLGLPAFITGKFLAHSLGTGVAICSIFVGNIILWLVGLTVISTIYQERTNAIQNINGYIGKVGGLLFALILTRIKITHYLYN
jgi:hypothetical protein